MATSSTTRYGFRSIGPSRCWGEIWPIAKREGAGHVVQAIEALTGDLAHQRDRGHQLDHQVRFPISRAIEVLTWKSGPSTRPWPSARPPGTASDRSRHRGADPEIGLINATVAIGSTTRYGFPSVRPSRCWRWDLAHQRDRGHQLDHQVRLPIGQAIKVLTWKSGPSPHGTAPAASFKPSRC